MRYTGFSLATALASVLLMASLSTTAESAAPCNPATCVHPACVCPSTKPPKGMDPKTVPQFFTLTFDDAVQAPTVPVARSLMAPHINPNGCPIKATWFAQTIYSDYSLIQQWYAAGNEVADHTMNHLGTPPAEEIVGNRKAINAFAGVPFSNLNGFRAPFLNYSDATFEILGREKFLYDSSTAATPSDAYWPYTLDNGLHNDCWNGICDKSVSIPGMWEIPMHAIMDSDLPTAIAHSMDVQLDAPATAVSEWLRKNFDRHYDGDRAPFGIFLHPVHVGNATQLYNDFFAYAKSLPDVWFVTNQQLLEWMKNPVPASQLGDQPYMKCTQPMVGKEICNGLDDTKSGADKVDKTVIETCNFVSGPWSTCYGCPKSMPSPSDPVPERVVAAGQAGYRTPVPANCAMEWWDPVAAQCMCQNSNCAFVDTAIPTNTSGKGSSSPGGDSSSPKNGASTPGLKDAWTTVGLVFVAAAVIQLF